MKFCPPQGLAIIIKMTKSKYYIYRNLRTGGFSIKFKGKVIERFYCAIFTNVQFKVSELLRLQVIHKKRKNVHAYVVVDDINGIGRTIAGIDGLSEIKYNPYYNRQFTCNGKEIYSASKIFFKNGKCYLLKD